MGYASEALINIYEEIRFDHFYLSNLWSHLVYLPLKGGEDYSEWKTYGKSVEQIAKDTVTILRFMLATGDFIIRKDLIDEKFINFPAVLETEEDIKLVGNAYIKLQNGDKNFEHFEVLYDIVLINDEAKIPVAISDEVASVFQHV